ncbi:MAG: hypothetical protein JSU92_05440 [Deltaproteobacteria bacterium]|nr:MAG: hypothetical protein JSU92_05440 [Deltaproteobacteria bacterium]
MQIGPAHRALAEKYLHKDTFKEIIVLDSLLNVLAYTFTEEEAEIINQLGMKMQSPKSIAKKVNRPVDEVQPILQSLAERVLIIGFTVKGVSLYGLMPLYPMVYDAQMLMSDKKMREGDSGEFYKEFTRLFKEFWEEFNQWLCSQEVAKRYQIFGVPYGRIISVERAIEASPGLGVIAFPTDIYSEMVERSKKSLCLINVCACRQGMVLLGKGCGRLENTCSTMGLPAEGAIKAGMGRRVSKEEFLEAKMRATESGLVHMTENTRDPILVCSCCSCCCAIMRTLKQFNSPNILTQSHFEAVIDPEKCKGFKICLDFCPMGAITMKDKEAVIDYKRCSG